MTTYTTACGKRVVYVHHSCLLLPTADIELLCTYNWCVCVCVCASPGMAHVPVLQGWQRQYIEKERINLTPLLTL